MQIFFEPTNTEQWNLFDKVPNIGHVETFKATFAMHIGDFMLIHVRRKDETIENGVYAVGEIISEPYVLHKNPEDYYNDKLTVDVKIIKLRKDKPIIEFSKCSEFTNNYRRANKIDSKHYNEILEIINNN